MKKISLNTKIKVNPKIVYKKLKGSFYLLDPDKGKVHILNETASFIWEAVKKSAKVGEIIDSMVKEFNVKKEVARKDVLEFINKYLERKFIKIVS